MLETALGLILAIIFAIVVVAIVTLKSVKTKSDEAINPGVVNDNTLPFDDTVPMIDPTNPPVSIE
jgi:hypothetical protein